MIAILAGIGAGYAARRIGYAKGARGLLVFALNLLAITLIATVVALL